MARDRTRTAPLKHGPGLQFCHLPTRHSGQLTPIKTQPPFTKGERLCQDKVFTPPNAAGGDGHDAGQNGSGMIAQIATVTAIIATVGALFLYMGGTELIRDFCAHPD